MLRSRRAGTASIDCPDSHRGSDARLANIGSSEQRGSTAADDAALLAGAIDIHVHSAPDNVPRSIDGLEAAGSRATRACARIVLKNHYDPTAGLAYLARKAVPGVEVFGGIDLNLTVGGMNPWRSST